MRAFSRLANPLIKDTRFLNVITGGLKTANNISKEGGEIHVGVDNLSRLPTTGVKVYAKLLDECTASPLKASSLFSSAKDAVGDNETFQHTKAVWNLTNPDSKVV